MISGKGNLDKPFSNFHSKSSTAHDYKIRYAVENTIFKGSYMTDIIKDYEELISTNVMKYLKKNPDFEKENIQSFEVELNDISAKNPTLIAFGNDCYKILIRNLEKKYKIYKVSHYSSSKSKEELRTEFENIETKINDEVVNKQPKTEIKKSKSDIIEKKHKCDKCKIAFKHKYQLTNHEKTEKHKTGRRQKKKNIVKKEYKCTICNIYSTKQPTNYKLHILNNHKTTEEKEKKFPHYCKLCDFGSFEKSKYDKHILTKKHKIASEAIKNK